MLSMLTLYSKILSIYNNAEIPIGYFFSMPKFQYDPTSNAANQEIHFTL